MAGEALQLNNVPPEASEVAQQALAFIDDMYGREPEQADTRLAYHNGLHTRNVVTNFGQLAVVTGLDAPARGVGALAAVAHDLIQGTGRHTDEMLSAEWLAEKMRNHGFLKSEVDMARLAVLGTEPIFDGGPAMRQTVDELDFPSRTHEVVARAVASADLGRLYALDGPYMAHLLFKEANGKNPEPISEILDFQRGQIAFLDGYRFPLPEANTLFTIHKSQVIEYAAQLVTAIEKGTIETWDELLARDAQFAKNQ